MLFILTLFSIYIKTSAQSNIIYTSLFDNSTFTKAIDLTRPIGSIDANIDIDANGGATYCIPIKCAPGTNNIAPKLSIAYNSQGANSILGQGWTITGLSGISRSGKDIYHDGKVSGVDYSNADNFVLDGSRLSIKTGTNGANGATYRTESESYATTTSYGVLGDGPRYFNVIAKDGTLMQYGYSDDSRLMSDDNSKVMMWRINKIQDISGNYVDFIYDSKDRDFRIIQIKYTGNALTGLDPYNVIDFQYGIRDDQNTIYDMGYTLRSKFLLERINISSEGSLMKSYRFNYGKTYNNLSCLKFIEEFAANGSRLNDTRFKYGEATANPTITTSNIQIPIPGTTSGSYGTDEVILSGGDYNGDGINEIIVTDRSHAPTGLGGGGVRYDWKATGYKAAGYDAAGFSSFNLFSVNSSVKVVAPARTTNSSLSLSAIVNRTAAYSNISFADFNGDGKDDILSYAITSTNELDKLSIYYPNSGSTVTFTESDVAPAIRPALYSDNRFIPNNFIIQGDFDGDKATDFVTIIQDIHNRKLGSISFPIRDELNKYLTWPSTPSLPGTYSPDPDVPKTFTDADKLFVIDFNGDGKSEILVIKGSASAIYGFKKEAHGGYSLLPLYTGSYPSTTQSKIYVGDFNGDGKTDILTGTNAGLWFIGYSTGTGFVQNVFVWDSYSSSCSFGASDQIYVADFNGDGKSDVLNFRRDCSSASNYLAKSYLDIYYSNGPSRIPVKSSTEIAGVPNNDIAPLLLDVTGDGIVDFCFQRSTSAYLQILSFDRNSRSRLLTKVTDGFNQTIEFNYEPLTKGTGTGIGDFYTKESGETYPVNNGQYPIYVVTTMNAPDGIGGIKTVNYKYENIRLNRTGRGLLGFEKVRSYDMNTGIRTETIYDLNRDLYVSYPKTTRMFLNSTGAQLTQLDNTVAFDRIGSGFCYLRKNTSVVKQDLLKGVTITERNTFDAYGNVILDSVTTTGGSLTETMTTTSTFIATGGSTILNRPSEIITRKKRGAEPEIAVKNIFTYYSSGLLKDAVTAPLSSSLYYVKNYHEYDVYGNNTLKEASAYSGFITQMPATRYKYDDKGRFMTEEENVLNDKKTLITDKFWGKPLSITAYNGLTTTFQYDSWGNIVSTTIPTSISTSYVVNYSKAWDISGKQLFYSLKEDPSAPDVKTWYDILGRPLKSQQQAYNGSWTTSITTYDNRGNVATSTNGYLPAETPVVTTNVYDAMNRIVSSAVTGFGKTKYGYELGSGLLTVIDTLPDGRIKKEVIDASGKTIKSADGIAGVVHYQYDSRGNEIRTGIGTIGSSFNDLVRKEYDIAGRLKKMVDPDAGTTTYNYNLFGQLISQINPKGKTTSFMYDIAGKVIKKEIDAYYITNYTYYGADKDYRLKSEVVTSPEGTVSDVYDYAIGGPMTLHTRSINGSLFEEQYTYDSYNNRITTTNLNSGFKTRNYYDANGFLQKITTNFTGVPATEKILYHNLSMNGNGQVTQHKRVDGRTATTNYYSGIATGYSTPGIQDLQMNYDYSNGNLLSRFDNITGTLEEFGYDAIGRLTNAQSQKVPSPGGIPPAIHTPLTMSYDDQFWGSLGRMTSKSDIGAYTYSASPRNAVKSVTDPVSLISHETQVIDYNRFDKTKSINERIGTVDYQEEFIYDAEESRAYSQQKQGGAITRKRWYMGDFEVCQNIPAATTQMIHYISGNEGLCGIVVEDGTNFKYYAVYTDHLGSIVTITDDAGTVVCKQSFDPWGRERNPLTWDYVMSPMVKPDWLYRGYTGHEMLPEYGLVNMNGRMYDPANGRMLRPDNNIAYPDNTQSYNRYSYAMNNPMTYVDPDGNMPAIAAAAIIGGAINGLMYAYQVSKSPGGFRNWDWMQFGFSVGTGAIGGVIGHGIGTAFSGPAGIVGNSPFLTEVTKAGFHGASGYISSGGNINGFYSGALGSLSGPLQDLAGGPVSGTVFGRTMFAAGIGGTGAAINGGDFWQGAAIAATVHLVNQEMHRIKNAAVLHKGKNRLTLARLLKHYALGTGEDYAFVKKDFSDLINELDALSQLPSFDKFEKVEGVDWLYVVDVSTYGTSFENASGNIKLYATKDAFVGYSDWWNFERQASGQRKDWAEMKTTIGRSVPGKPFWVLYGITPFTQNIPKH